MKTLALFDQLRSVTRQHHVKLHVQHENLETVYIEPTAEGHVLVHDWGHVHTYLSTSTDQSYRTWEELGVEHLRVHCERLGLSLEKIADDEYGCSYWICSQAASDLELADLVDRVAACQEAIFEAAVRKPR